MKTPGLTPQQAAAVNGHGNLLIVAGAGTGKTHTLIARCLRLITEERVSLESLLLVTFTEAAAAEMRGRLRQELLKLQLAAPENDWIGQQLGLLDTAHISTLHGFCLQLAREHFHALGLDPQFGVLDESQTRPLQREALEELLERRYNGSDGESLAVQRLIRAVGRGSDQRIRNLILKLHAHARSLPAPERWLEEQQSRFAATEPDEWRQWFAQAVAELRDTWLAEVQSLAGNTRALELAANALGKLAPAPTFAEAAAAVQALTGADADENWPRGTKGKFRDPLSRFFGDVEFLGSFASEPGAADPLRQDWEWARGQMAALLLLAREFGESFSRKKRELGGVDFSDLEQCALQLLRDDTVAGEWRARLAHLFVDEYQDINAAQDAILTALSRSGTAANRFLVGDVKQSIYRFRLANPKIFQRYHDEWTKPDPDEVEFNHAISLTDNFRCREALINFVNPLFAALMRRDVGGVDYEALEFGAPVRRADLLTQPDASPPVEFHLICKPDEPAAAEEDELDDEPVSRADQPDLLAVEREARLVARRVRELKDAAEPVWDKEQKCFRPVQWSDMAVLLRSPSGRAEAFAMEFNRAGVPLSAARDGFFTSLEVGDLLNLLKLLDNPLQDVPLAAVLRSPLVGLSLEELALVRCAERKELLWTALVRVLKSGVQCLKSETLSRIELFHDQFHRWREVARQTSLSQTLETALTETHYESLLLAGERGAQRVANVRRLLDLARQFDPFQRQGLYRFLRFVRLQEEEELDLEPASAPTGDAVRLLSIHKSKGLEFPLVVLAGLGTRFNEQDLSGAVLLDEALGLCPRISPPHTEQSYPGLTHGLARQRARRELRGEELRLFYVALTRARDRLILVGTTSDKTDDARWAANPDPIIATRELLAARSHLDWLMLWLSRATSPEHWRTGREGANPLLHWRVSEATDPIFTTESADQPVVARPMNHPAPAGALGELKSRLDWNYPFSAATTESAKTSVTALRRRAADETDDEAAKLFHPDLRASRSNPAKLSAAEIGLAHHSFLERVDLANTGNEAALRAEADRLQRNNLLSAEQTAVLDLKSLAAFWTSDLGIEIRQHAATVKRELPFTARFAKAELVRLIRNSIQPANPPAVAETDADFVVVQGVADLAVLSPQEIWLLDFKTDQVAPGQLKARVKEYTPQLQIYALALGRIYNRPVTRCWLHFLAARRTETVEPPACV